MQSQNSLATPFDRIIPLLVQGVTYEARKWASHSRPTRDIVNETLGPVVETMIRRIPVEKVEQFPDRYWITSASKEALHYLTRERKDSSHVSLDAILDELPDT